MAHQDNLGLGAFQLRLLETFHQRLERLLVLEAVRFLQAARALHQQGHDEGIDFHGGRIVAADHGDGCGLLDMAAQVLVGAHVFVFRPLDGVVQHFIFLLIQGLADQAAKFHGLFGQHRALRIAVFLLRQVQGHGAQHARDGFILVFGRVGGFTGNRALIFGHGDQQVK
ncbi:hypothetical protein D3C81_255020 [compost metagenome]